MSNFLRRCGLVALADAALEMLLRKWLLWNCCLGNVAQEVLLWKVLLGKVLLSDGMSDNGDI